MTGQTSILDPSCPGAGVVHCSALGELVGKGVSGKVELAIWKRSLAAPFAAAFERLSFDGFRDFRADGPAGHVGVRFSDFLDQSGWTPDACLALKADANIVLQAAETRAPGSEYTIRLEHISDDACCKFHKDNTDFRIVTTYLGRGTQWARLKQGALGEIQTLDRFDVGLFLGQRARRSDTILHRSPPVRSISEHRLLLVIDVERPAWRTRQGGR